MAYAPVVLFAYKRVDKLKACVEALEKNILAEDTELYIFCDGPKDEKDIKQVQEVREYLRNYSGKFKSVSVSESSCNIGLADSIICGVTKVINISEKVIVVEDDLITSQDFLLYMNGALDFYKDLKEYGSISAYTYPLRILETYDKDVYVTRKGECWGWGTWKNRWDYVDWTVSDFREYKKNKMKRKEFESLQYGIDKMLFSQMNGKIDSWAVRWCYYLFNNHLLTVYPRISRTYNIGFDGSGTHCANTNIYHSQIINSVGKCKYEHLSINREIEKEAAVFEKRTFLQKVLNKIKEVN